MKILIINWQDIKNPFGGGAEVHLHEIFRRIAASGHSVTLFCSEFENAPKYEIIDGIEIIREGSRNMFNFHVPFKYLTKFRREGYDIIIDDINKIPFYTPLYVRKPLLAISHHFFGRSIFREASLPAALYVNFAEYMINFIYKKTPFAVVSESTKQEFVGRGFDPSDFKIIQNAITQSEFPMHIGEKSHSPTVAYFGRLKKYKSVDHLLQAFAIVIKSVPNAKLLIMGRGDFQPQLEELSNELKISKQIIFFGYVTDEEKVRYLTESYCAVNTSMKEGWGITNIEANACGTPVISANVPGLKDSVSAGVSGLLYEYGNIHQLADLITKVLTDNNLRIKLSEGAVSWAKSFTWDESARLMIRRCEEVIENKQK